MISGGVTVSVEDIDSVNTVQIQQKVTNATKSIMDDDALLSSGEEDIKKVKFLEDKPEATPINVLPPPVNGGNEGVIIGASLAVLASVLLALLIGKKKYSEAKKAENGPFGLVQFPALSTDSSSSLVAVDSKDLGKHASGHDVHVCKSATCPKCYVGPKVDFIKAPAIDLKCQECSKDPEESIPQLHESISPASSQSSSTTTEFY